MPYSNAMAAPAVPRVGWEAGRAGGAQAALVTHPRLALLSLGGATAAPPFTAAQLRDAAGALMADVTVAEHTGLAAAELGAPTALPPLDRPWIDGARAAAPCGSVCTSLIYSRAPLPLRGKRGGKEAWEDERRLRH